MVRGGLLRLRNMLFAAVIGIVMLAPAVLFCSQRVLHMGLPAWLSAEEATYLSGGGSDVNLRAQATLHGFASGSFQDALTTEIGNFVPAKASALLGNAALQRGAIAASDSLFGWGFYPTYYGSRVYYLPEYDALAGLPMRDTEEVRAGLRAFAEGLARFADAHLDKDFHVVIPDSWALSALFPSSRLVNDPLDAEKVEDLLRESWGGCSNVFLSIAAYDEPSQFMRDFYHTDGHWNGYGALRAYEGLSQAMPQARSVWVDGRIEGPIFNGQSARQGLMLMDYPADEPRFDMSTLRVVSGETGWVTAGDGQMFGEYPLEAEFNFYASWYGGDSNTVIVNEDGQDDVLLISDSFGWVLAQSFGTVYNCVDLHSKVKGEEALEERIAQSDADTVVFVGQLSDYMSFVERCPEYFDSHP